MRENSQDPATRTLIAGAQQLAAGKTLGLTQDQVFLLMRSQARRERKGLIGPQRQTEQETIADLIRQAKQSEAAVGNAYEGLGESRIAGKTGQMLRPVISSGAATSGAIEEYDTVRGGGVSEFPKADEARVDLREERGEKDLLEKRESERRSENRAIADEKRKRRERDEYEIGREMRGLRALENPLTVASNTDGREFFSPNEDQGLSFVDNKPAMDALLERQQLSVERLGREERVRVQSGEARRNFNNLAAKASRANAPLGFSQTFPGTSEYGSATLQREFEDGTGPFAQNYGAPSLYRNSGVRMQPQIPSFYSKIDITQRSGPNPAVPVLDLASSNTPTTSQVLNAPQPQSARSFVIDQSNLGSSFTQDSPYPQVDIGSSLGALDAAISRTSNRQDFTGLADSAPREIRSIDALQKASDAILRIGEMRGQKFSENVGGQTIEGPSVAAALQKLGLSESARERVGLALSSLGEARKQEPYTSKEAVTFPIVPAGSFNSSNRTLGEVVPTKRIYPGTIPMGFDGGAGSIRRVEQEGEKSFGTKLQKAVKEGTVTDSDAAAPFIGAAAESAIPFTTRLRLDVDTAEDIPAIKRLQYLAASMKGVSAKPTATEAGLLARGTTAMRKQNPDANPRFNEVMDFLENQYEIRKEKGNLKRKKDGTQKTIDEPSYNKMLDRNMKARKGADKYEENLAMAKLLEEPLLLKPGPYPASMLSPAEIASLRVR